MLPSNLLITPVVVKRRVSTGRDSLNNPNYGDPTTGDGWHTIYPKMMCRLAFSTKEVRFAPEGERIQPTGIMYYNTGFILKAEDRILTPAGIEYNIIGISAANVFGGVIDHYEAVLQLP